MRNVVAALWVARPDSSSRLACPLARMSSAPEDKRGPADARVVNLEDRARSLAADFDNAPVPDILSVLGEVIPLLRSEPVAAYLQKKLDGLRSETDESERRAKCAALRPYVDWYLQGLQK